MIVERFAPHHFEQIELQAQMRAAREHLTPAALRHMASQGPAFTARRADGVILACAGLDESTQDAAWVWCFMSRHGRNHLISLTRAARRLLSVASCPMILATALCGFEPGCRLLELLDFKRLPNEGMLGPDGNVYHIYARAA